MIGLWDAIDRVVRHQAGRERLLAGRHRARAARARLDVAQGRATRRCRWCSSPPIFLFVAGGLADVIDARPLAGADDVPGTWLARLLVTLTSGWARAWPRARRCAPRIRPAPPRAAGAAAASRAVAPSPVELGAPFVVVGLDLDGGVRDVVARASSDARLVEHAVRVGAGADHHVRAGDVHLRRERPHVQVVHVDDARAAPAARRGSRRGRRARARPGAARGARVAPSRHARGRIQTPMIAATIGSIGSHPRGRDHDRGDDHADRSGGVGHRVDVGACARRGCPARRRAASRTRPGSPPARAIATTSIGPASTLDVAVDRGGAPLRPARSSRPRTSRIAFTSDARISSRNSPKVRHPVAATPGWPRRSRPARARWRRASVSHVGGVGEQRQRAGDERGDASTTTNTTVSAKRDPEPAHVLGRGAAHGVGVVVRAVPWAWDRGHHRHSRRPWCAAARRAAIMRIMLNSRSATGRPSDVVLAADGRVVRLRRRAGARPT